MEKGDALLPPQLGPIIPWCRRRGFIRQGVACFPSFMLLFGSHDVIHPTQERRSPELTGSGEEQNAQTASEFAVLALDGVELD